MLAKGAALPILLSSIPAVILFAAAYLFLDILFYFGIIMIILPLLTSIFFRDPKRSIGNGIVAPADGKIVIADNVNKRLDIFMNITDVHVNRAPSKGKIIDTKFIPGTHKPAFLEHSSENMKHIIVLNTDYGNIIIHQITGIFARRIVPYVKKGNIIDKGERIGIIRFGSRVRLDLPKKANIIVKKGEKVRGGETKIGEWYEDE